MLQLENELITENQHPASMDHKAVATEQMHSQADIENFSKF